MNELSRLAYLDAMGIDSYVSRGQLAGAAATRRLALVREAAPERAQPDAPVRGEGPALLREQVVDRRPARARPEPAPVERPPERAGGEVPRLSFAVLGAGQWLWLESLGDLPLMREQVWLTESMANALGVAAGKALGGQRQPKATVTQFGWPIHNNPQLDSGADAARASLAGFLERQLAEQSATGLVLMGEECQQWVQPHTVPLVTLPSTRQMLSDSTLKRRAWDTLLSLIGQ